MIWHSQVGSLQPKTKMNKEVHMFWDTIKQWIDELSNTKEGEPLGRSLELVITFLKGEVSWPIVKTGIARCLEEAENKEEWVSVLDNCLTGIFYWEESKESFLQGKKLQQKAFGYWLSMAEGLAKINHMKMNYNWQDKMVNIMKRNGSYDNKENELSSHVVEVGASHPQLTHLKQVANERCESLVGKQYWMVRELRRLSLITGSILTCSVAYVVGYYLCRVLVTYPILVIKAQSTSRQHDWKEVSYLLNEFDTFLHNGLDLMGPKIVFAGMLLLTYGMLGMVIRWWFAKIIK